MNKINLSEVEFRIGKPSSGREESTVVIEITDKSSHIQFFELEMPLADFAQAAITNISSVNAKNLKLRGLDKIGKTHECKEFSFRVPREEFEALPNIGDRYKSESLFYKSLAAYGQKLVNATYPGEGWILDSYFGAQKSINQDSKTNEYKIIGYIRRYV